MTAQLEIPVETILRDALASGDELLSSISSILSHLVATPDNALFNDQVIASVRWRAADVAQQLLMAQGEAQPGDDVAGFVAAAKDELAADFLSVRSFLLHCHALTIEGQLALSLQKRSGLDPVLPPFIQAAIAAHDVELASAAMSVLAAQARFMQYHRRMALPMTELPDVVFDALVIAWQNFAGTDAKNALAQAEMKLRRQRDEATPRVILIDRMIQHHGRTDATLSLSHAGVHVFATGLSVATAQPRSAAILALTEQQGARLALALRAAGISGAEIVQQFGFLHPDRAAPEAIGTLRGESARALLQGANAAIGEL